MRDCDYNDYELQVRKNKLKLYKKSGIVGKVIRPNILKLYREYFEEKKAQIKKDVPQCFYLVREENSFFISDKEIKDLASQITDELEINLKKIIGNVRVGDVLVRSFTTDKCYLENKLIYLQLRMEAKLPTEYRN